MSLSKDLKILKYLFDLINDQGSMIKKNVGNKMFWKQIKRSDV